MPGVDGFMAAEEIRAEGSSVNARIIAVSADHRRQDDPRLAACGICDFVPKPIASGRLLAAILAALPSGPVREPRRRVAG